MLDKAGYDAAEVFDRCFIGGSVYSDQETIILAEWEDGHVPSLFIWLAIGKNRMQRFCELAPPGLVQVSFARGLRGRDNARSYSFDRIKRLCKMTPSTAAVASPKRSSA
jgi:hypothetical protein